MLRAGNTIDAEYRHIMIVEIEGWSAICGTVYSKGLPRERYGRSAIENIPAWRRFFVSFQALAIPHISYSP
ncbi:hypothetical protein AB833_28565 [Chromatiales bacterium (ex Bugula neritina AB1)]|nr:hypothetical protein AB833_28565 [Chromatiales bacterium (ex Bugula neritina AB1)]